MASWQTTEKSAVSRQKKVALWGRLFVGERKKMKNYDAKSALPVILQAERYYN